MRSMRVWIVCGFLILATVLAAGLRHASAQGDSKAVKPETGYAVKKPVFGGACPVCPWGAMAEVVKTVMKPYGWDVQICYYCAGGPRAARLLSAKAMATPPDNPTADTLPTPKGPIDFGATGTEYVEAAYAGTQDFAKDPEGPRKQLRLIANIQEPTYFMVAVKATSGITDLKQIAEKRIPVKLMMRGAGPRDFAPAMLDYYKLNKENVESYGGTFSTAYSRDADYDVIVGFGSLVNAPEYNVWYQSTQKFDFKYLELAKDLRLKLQKDYHFEERNIPLGLFRGVDHTIPTLVRNGDAVYGRTDMPDDFAYTLAKALDERQDLLAWTHMNWSYNWRTVWKAGDVPLHPGAARYYKERGYMK